MTTRIFSFSTLRSLAASARSGHLAGSAWRSTDRDLDRVAGDLLAVAHADPERLAVPTTLAAPVDLGARRARSAAAAAPSSTPHAGASHAQAS